MRVFITGAASFIGQSLMTAAVARGIQVTCVDRVAVDQPDCHVIDVCDPAIGDVIPQGVDAIVHLAALSRDADCRDNALACFGTNVMGTLNLTRAARARGARQFIFASTEWVYDSFVPGEDRVEDSPIDASRLGSEYALSKFVSENTLRQQGPHGFCPATILRFGIVYGPRRANWSAVESLLSAVATADEVEVGSLATARRFIHVQDIAEATLAAVGWTAPYDIFNIQGPDQASLGRIIAASATLLGRSPRVVESAPAAASIRTVSSGKATAKLGWSAAISIEDGLASVAAHLGLT